jgi:hypothetical protein
MLHGCSFILSSSKSAESIKLALVVRTGRTDECVLLDYTMPLNREMSKPTIAAFDSHPSLAFRIQLIFLGLTFFLHSVLVSLFILPFLFLSLFKVETQAIEYSAHRKQSSPPSPMTKNEKDRRCSKSTLPRTPQLLCPNETLKTEPDLTRSILLCVCCGFIQSCNPPR